MRPKDTPKKLYTNIMMKLKKLRYNVTKYDMPGTQMGHPCFDWSLDLVLGGWPSKIEVLGVPGVYTLMQIFKEHVQIHTSIPGVPIRHVFFFLGFLLFFWSKIKKILFQTRFWCHIVVLWCCFCCALVSDVFDVFGCVSPLLACVMFLVETNKKTSNGGPGIYMYILYIPFNNTWIFGAKKNYPTEKNS